MTELKTFWKYCCIGAFSVASLVAFTQEAAAMCGERNAVAKLLSNRYKEAPVALGVVADKGVMEVYVSGTSGTWSIVVTSPQGKTCIIAAGQNWEDLERISLDPQA